MDFYRIAVKETKERGMEIYPDFVVGRSKDLMVQGKSFYAIWDEEKGLWSRDEYDVQRLVDEELDREAERLGLGGPVIVKHMRSFGSNSWAQFRKFLANVSDSSHPLDSKLIFANTEVKKTDYASKRLPYAIGEGDVSAWDELISTLYSPAERAKSNGPSALLLPGTRKRFRNSWCSMAHQEPARARF